MLLAHDFSIQYRSTTSLDQADALSRLLDSHHSPENIIASMTVDPAVNSLLISAIRTPAVTASIVQVATARDPLLQRVLTYFTSLQLPPTKG